MSRRLFTNTGALVLAACGHASLAALTAETRTISPSECRSATWIAAKLPWSVMATQAER